MKQLSYHNFYLNEIKKRSKAKFVAYEEYQGRYKLKVIKKDGEEVYYALHGTPNDVTVERYTELLNSI